MADSKKALPKKKSVPAKKKAVKKAAPAPAKESKVEAQSTALLKKETGKLKPAERSLLQERVVYPLITEKAVNMIEGENKLVFVVRKNLKKHEVKEAIEKLYDVKVSKVNIMNDAKARKRAFVRISKEHKADEIATKLGVL